MSRTVIPAELRLAVWQRAKSRCEYCLLNSEDATVPHQPDHIIAVQHGGLSNSENLALACYECNLFKGPNISSIDPVSGQASFLFNPRRQAWAEHFKYDGASILGLTPIARATIFLLRMNLPDRIRLRSLLQLSGRYPARNDSA